MVTSNKARPFLLQEYGRMLVLVQIYRSACVWWDKERNDVQYVKVFIKH